MTRERNTTSQAEREKMDQFESYRLLLFSIAYRMLGSVSEAEDTLQDAYLRYRAMPAGAIAAPKAFLSTVVTRLCLNHLQAARVQRESYLGPWLPEPLVTEEDPESPISQAERLESISMAFLVLLERLTPVERAVFLLREVFDYAYPEIAAIVDKEEASCRQILSRAKKRLAAERPRFTPSTEQHQHLLRQFLEAVEEGNLVGLTRLLASDVMMWTDGGGKALGAATRSLHGQETVARFILGSLRRFFGRFAIEFCEVNREPALLVRTDGHLFSVVSMTIEQQHIVEIRVIANPDKLRHLA
jgi:RNA polymerase sigma-70 factor (ECF subfamily)